MFINPRHVIEQGWITGPQQTIDEKYIQPNALDFTIDRLFSINDNDPFIISDRGKTMRGGNEIIPTTYSDPADGIPWEGLFWNVESHKVYDAMSNFHVKVPDDVAVMLIIRSTFNRNGLFLTSGLYDTGFDGSVGFAIPNRSGVARIAPGTRVGQIMFMDADSAGKYAGQYNTEARQHWTETR